MFWSLEIPFKTGFTVYTIQLVIERSLRLTLNKVLKRENNMFIKYVFSEAKLNIRHYKLQTDKFPH